MRKEKKRKNINKMMKAMSNQDHLSTFGCKYHYLTVGVTIDAPTVTLKGTGSHELAPLYSNLSLW